MSMKKIFLLSMLAMTILHRMGCRAAQRNGPITSASLAEQSVVAVSEPESANQEQNVLLFAAILKEIFVSGKTLFSSRKNFRDAVILFVSPPFNK